MHSERAVSRAHRLRREPITHGVERSISGDLRRAAVGLTARARPGVRWQCEPRRHGALPSPDAISRQPAVIQRLRRRRLLPRRGGRSCRGSSRGRRRARRRRCRALTSRGWRGRSRRCRSSRALPCGGGRSRGALPRTRIRRPPERHRAGVRFLKRQAKTAARASHRHPAIRPTPLVAIHIASAISIVVQAP